MYCSKCGRWMSDGSSFCPSCGASQGSTVQSAPPSINVVVNQEPTNALGYTPKKKWPAFWLCLFFGLVGAHRFYVGKWFTGILWALSAGGFIVGWVTDLHKILFNKFRDAHGMPLV